jgi:hypothetical protein
MACRKAIELNPTFAGSWNTLGSILGQTPGRRADAEMAFRRAIELAPGAAVLWNNLLILLALTPERAADAEMVSRETCQTFPSFGRILLGICDLVQERDNSDRFARLYRAVALGQLGDFPRASVALEDALTGDPIDLLSIGQGAIETFPAAAVTSGRVRDCLDLIDKKKDWKDAWRPIYEALQAVEAGSAEYLKRIAVEIRNPALEILRRIAPQLPGFPERTS